MKKIGILTFHRAINYGAVLQTYALQKTIERSGKICEIIDYRNDFLEELHDPKNLKKYKSYLHYIYAVLKNTVKRDNRKNFKEFRRKYLKMSLAVYTRENIADTNQEYGLFIAGSDQVWNRSCSNFDDTYFLNFVSDKNLKCSYAASIGIKLETEEERNVYRRLLEDYSYVYVREEQAKLELDSIGIKSEVTLDPTLLLNKNEWMELAQKPDTIRGHKKYLLVYVIVETPSIFKLANRIAEERDLEIVYINEMRSLKRGVKNLVCITPNEWLWLFANADFIVTNSFHGTAFSVNFEKQFVVEPLPVKTNVNSRIYDFLNMMGISGRTVNGKDFLPKGIVDYKKINMDNYRSASLSALRAIWDNKK